MNNILVPYDFQSQSVMALEWALLLARKLNCGITILYVNEAARHMFISFDQDQHEEFIEKISDQLDTIAVRASLQSGLNIDSRFQLGRVYTAILGLAAELHSDFIVMGTRSTNPSDNHQKPMVGRNTSRVIRMSKCPVITIGGNQLPLNGNSVLLPLDLTKITRQKISWAIKMAGIYGAGIKAVSALWSQNNPEIVARLFLQMEQVKETIEAAGIKCTTKIIETPAGEKTSVPVLLDYAKQEGDIELIIIMTQQEWALVDYFVGSHAQEFIRNAEIPVMSVVPEETES
jgi:nucleotide-binding universal stress UspA family protein